jgi:nucleotide-binding universal stress UspA family protein
MKKDEAEPDPEKVQIITRTKAKAEDDSKSVSEESRKGFDLMLVGLGETHDAEGAFNEPVTALAKEFKGSLAVLTTNDRENLPPLNRRLRILVPINGTPAARNAAEIALAIARPTGARVTALYVSATSDATRRGITRTQEEAVLKDIADLGERYDVSLNTALQPKGNAESAILKNANGTYNLIVMGVSQRPGDQLFFGNTANAILKKWKGAVLFVAS